MSTKVDSKTSKCSIIVPCYNEEKNIEALVQAFQKVVQKYEIELILVDNGSSDNTRQEIEKQRKENSFIQLVVVEKNQGYGFGILSGLRKASGQSLGWIHADLQSNPEVFIRMIDSAKKEQGSFLYKGARTNRDGVSMLFTKGMALFETVLFHTKLEDVNSQPTLLSRDFYESWKNPPYDFSLDLYAYVLALKKKVTIRRFESKQRERLAGNSSWNNGLRSRINMIARVVNYSKDVKKRMEQYEN